jgi:hypothetical protein
MAIGPIKRGAIIGRSGVPHAGIGIAVAADARGFGCCSSLPDRRPEAIDPVPPADGQAPAQ